jgi:hypothetical protein
MEVSLRLHAQAALSLGKELMVYLTLNTILYALNETNLMNYLSSVYSVTIPLHVSGWLVAHLKEVTMYICDNWYVLYVLVDCRWDWLSYHRLLPPDVGQLATPKHIEAQWLNKLKISSASSWIHYTHISRCRDNRTLKNYFVHQNVLWS